MLLALLHAYLQNRKQLFLGVAKIAAKWTDLTFLPPLTLTPSQIPKYNFFWLNMEILLVKLINNPYIDTGTPVPYTVRMKR